MAGGEFPPPVMFADFGRQIKGGRRQLGSNNRRTRAFAKRRQAARMDWKMNDDAFHDTGETSGDGRLGPPEAFVILAEEAPPQEDAPPPRPRRRRWQLPLLLFLVTCWSTYAVGGWLYAVAVMTILVCHEAGHFLQARRYGVAASLPFFIPMPFSPIGTMGAVIAMEARVGDRKALFDIGITGPLAGLVPTLICCVVGLHFSHVAPFDPRFQQFGEPLLLKLLVWLKFGPLPAGHDVYLHPVAWAGWVGLLVTALNLIPIGQLDGGHILYGLLRKKAHFVATFLLAAALVAAVFFWLWWWWLMLFLLIWMGPKHPPTAGDDVPLGMGRIVLGWLTLAFIVIGFTPRPFMM